MSVHGPWIADALTTYLAGETVKALAVSSAHSASPDMAYRSSVTAELSGGGYVAGGVVVTGLSVAYADGRVTIDCDLIDFGDVTASDIAGVALYVSTGSAATDPMLASAMFAPVEAAGSLTYDPGAYGFIQVTFP